MTAQRDTPCKCGWKFLSFHICVDLSNDKPGAIFPKCKKTKKSTHPLANPNLQQSQAERWERHHEQNRVRDEKIVERYKQGGVGCTVIAKEFNMARSSVLKVLHRAQEEGLVDIRRRGYTLAKGAK